MNILNQLASLSSDATFGADATAWNTKVANSVAYTGSTDVAVGTIVNQSFTLTTGVDTWTGGAGNDTVNAILGTGATLNSFDSINGAAGTADSLNIADNSTAVGGFAMPASVTLSGFENVTLSRSGATGGADVTVTNSTFGSGVSNLSIVNAGANTTGPVSVTLNSATTVSAVSTGTAFTTVAVTDTFTTAASTGSTLTTVSITGSTGNGTLTGNGITTLNLNGAATGGTVTVTAATATRALTVNTAGTTDSGAVTDSKATSLTLNETSAANVGT